MNEATGGMLAVKRLCFLIRYCQKIYPFFVDGF